MNTLLKLQIHKIYTDETGHFPTPSNRGIRYCFVLYHYDSNAIFVYPIKIIAPQNF